MNPKTKLPSGTTETVNDTVARAKSMLETAASGKTDTPATGNSSSVLDTLVERLTQQGQGISTSASSNLQASIDSAIASTQEAGALSSAALESERQREKSFAQDRGSATITNAMEGRSGYATQVAGLRELTETTEKSIRDLDKRYQEAILSNDSATAQRVADMQLKKQEFLMTQEQNFYQNLMGVANLQQTALDRQQQNEQFWTENKQKNDQFAQQMSQSKYEFESNYGLNLQEIDLKEKQLEIERSRYNLSLTEYNDRKKALEQDKSNTFFKGIIGNTLKNSMYDKEGNLLSKEQIINTDMMMKIREESGFDGTTEELASLLDNVYTDITSDKKFMSEGVDKLAYANYLNKPQMSQPALDAYNRKKVEADTNRGVTIQSPESYWASILK